MSSWQIGLAGNAVIAVAYLAIVAAIVVPLARSNQLRSNPLGAATGGVFFTCAVHHGAHSVHMLLPSLGVSDPEGLAMRAAWGWPLATWDVIGALMAAYYWSLRRNYGSLMQGAQLFVDLRQREQQALELNDSVLQGLVVAKMALDLDQPAKAQDALAASIDSASRIITGLLGSKHTTLELLRSTPAQVGGLQPELQKITDELARTASNGTPSSAGASVSTSGSTTEGNAR
jgi:signal transduction histidine kinase